MKKKTLVKPVEKKVKSKNQTINTDQKKDSVEDEFDFGGLPKDVPFKRNIGCGG